MLTPSHLTPCLDFEEAIKESYGAYHEDEVYYEEPDLAGGVEGVDYLIAYGGDDEETET